LGGGEQCITWDFARSYDWRRQHHRAIDADIRNADLVAAAAKKAEAVLIKRYDFYWAIASSVGTVLLIGASFLGFGAWRNIRQGLRDQLRNDLRTELLASAPLKEELRSEVVKYVAADFEANSKRLERQILLNRLQHLSNKIKTQKSFSNIERDAMIKLLIAIKDDPMITENGDFKIALEHVLDAFYGASIWAKFDQIEQEFSHIIRESWGMVQTMVSCYGMRVIGEIEVDAGMIEKFNKYLDITEDLKYPEASLPWRMALQLAMPTEDHDRQIQIMIEECGDYDQDEISRLIRIIDRHTKLENFARAPKSYHRRLIQRFQRVRATLERYEVIPPLAELPVEAIAAPPA
jgi:hypothetical protein